MERFRGRLVLKKQITHYSSLNFHHLLLITYHWKYLNFLNLARLAHCFQLLITKKFVLFMGPTLWAPCQAHGYHTRVYPFSPHKSFFFFFFFSPIPRHTVQTPLCPSILFLSLSPNSADLHLTKYKQYRSLAKEILPAPISTLPNADLHRHLACKITSDGQQ